jgi:hypothetical protein
MRAKLLIAGALLCTSVANAELLVAETTISIAANTTETRLTWSSVNGTDCYLTHEAKVTPRSISTGRTVAVESQNLAHADASLDDLKAYVKQMYGSEIAAQTKDELLIIMRERYGVDSTKLALVVTTVPIEFSRTRSLVCRGPKALSMDEVLLVLESSYLKASRDF